MQSARQSRGSNIAFFVALMSTGLALGGALAHAYSLPNKMALGVDAFLHAQRAYDGWHFLGFVLMLQLIGIIWVIARHRRDRHVMLPAAIALALLVGAQIVFWIWTFPANQATANWTALPENWQALRAQWEYSHLAGAACQMTVMGALVIAVLRR